MRFLPAGRLFRFLGSGPDDDQADERGEDAVDRIGEPAGHGDAHPGRKLSECTSGDAADHAGNAAGRREDVPVAERIAAVNRHQKSGSGVGIGSDDQIEHLWECNGHRNRKNCDDDGADPGDAQQLAVIGAGIDELLVNVLRQVD